MVKNHRTLFLCLLLAGIANAAQISLLSENFEGSLTPLNWTLSGDWQIGTPSVVGPSSAIQGTRCAGTVIAGNYSYGLTSSMVTPVLSLPVTASQITFTFYEYSYVRSSYDYMYVEISTNSGSTWTQLFSTYTSNTVWAQRTADLTAYKGTNAQLRFRFVANSSYAYAGWYIDSVSVAATVVNTENLPHIAVAPGSFRIGASDSPQKTFTICNTGIKDTLEYSFNTMANVLVWTYGASTTSSPYLNTIEAITQKVPTATISTTATSDSATLRLLLRNSSVFLIPSQEYTTPSSTIGAAFRPVLDDFVRNGGIVIVTYPYYTGTTFLSYAGIDTLSSNTYTSSSYLVSVNTPTHPVFDSVSTSSVYTARYTGYWTSLTAPTVLASYSGYAVATEKGRGRGFIYVLGYNFYSSNTTTWGMMLANCIKKGFTTAKVAIDTAIGKVPPGGCKNLKLTFDRSGLMPGTNVMQLRILHNALLEPNPLSIPCTLIVDSLSIPHIAVAPGSFRIGSADSNVKTLTICNTGTRDSLQYTFNAGSNILAWTYGASTTSSAYLNTIAAISQRVPNATITTTTTTDSTTLRQLLRNNGVLLIPSQDYTTPSYTIGQAFAPVLDWYVKSGGVVIVLGAGYWGGTSFLSYAGLDTLSYASYTSSSYQVTLTSPTHPLFDSISSTVYTNSYTGYWTRTSASTILATYNGYTVVSEKQKGAGYIYLIGYNFYYADNATWGRMLAKCIKRGTTGVMVSADTLAGKVAAGACRNVRLTFNRAGLLPGTQIVQLRIQHNAILQPNPLSIPCTLVVDSTTMTFQKPSMAVTIFTGDTTVRNATMQNTGASLLNYYIVKKNGSGLLINEVNNYYDFVELVNPGSADVNIGGYRLVWTDNAGTSGSFTFPSNAIIRAKKFGMLYATVGTSSDSIFYLNNYLSWTYSTDLSVALLDAAGQGVDFFRTSGSVTPPPAGTTWSGTGYTRSGSDYNYYRTTLSDNNTAADWLGTSSSSNYTYLALNPGQSFSSGSATTGYITARADSVLLSAGKSTLVRFRYDALSMITGGVFIDTFQIFHNAKNLASPITVTCTLTVKSNIPSLVPVMPDPTVIKRPVMRWHPVASANVYTLEVAQQSSFSNLLIIQQTADTLFTPLVNLPVGIIYWRVRCDLNVRPSLPDNFVIQKDSIPVIIPIKPDTISGAKDRVFAWHPAVGATSYKMILMRIDTVATIVQTFVTDTEYVHPIALAKGKYQWTVSANFDYTQTAYPDTFWVGTPAAVIPVSKAGLPKAFDLKTAVSGRSIVVTCALARHIGSNGSPVPLKLELYDIKGKLVRTLFSGSLGAGYYQFQSTAGSMANGVYYCRMRWPGNQRIAPVQLVR